MIMNASVLRIGRSIHEIEDQIDRLIGKSGSLLEEITSARIQLDVDACDGQRPLQRLIEMQLRLVEARSKATGAHSDLRKIADARADIPVNCPGKGDGFLTSASAA
jgi:hypothetical protein